MSDGEDEDEFVQETVRRFLYCNYDVTTNDDEAALISTIREHPGDPTPRLVYADWLEERGDPRAEYLRLVVELAVESAHRRVVERREERLQELARTIDRDWRERVSVLYRVTLEWVDPNGGDELIRLLQLRFDLAWGRARDLTSEVPSRLVSGLLREEAEEMKASFEPGGWLARSLRPEPDSSFGTFWRLRIEPDAPS
jgi:uncharacterized protein (TIGR02996 family)